MRTLHLIALMMTGALLWGRGVTAEDYLKFEFVGAPVISPDGKMVVFPLTRIDEKLNRRMTSLWLVPYDGSAKPRVLTNEAVSSTAPQWSPDGKTLAFLSARGEGRPQLYLLPLEGGEPKKLTDLKNGVGAYQWSPMGDRFVVTSRTGPSDKGKVVSDVRHYTGIRYKFNDTGWFDDKRSHLFVVDAKTGSAKQITEGQEWEDLDPQWSPDGKRIAFVSNRTGKYYEDDRNTDVFTIAAEGGALTKVSDHAEADNSPRWSPDGKQIAFLGTTKRREFAKLYVAPAEGGASKLVVDGLDLIVGNLQWPSAGAMYFESGQKGAYQIYAVDVKARTAKAVVVGERAARFYHVRGGQLAYLVNDFQTLDDVFVAGVDGRGERRLTTHNVALWKELELAKVERMAYRSKDGTPVEGFLVKPLGFEAGKKYPLLLNIHGGPAGMYGVDWYHEFQVYAAKGYGVFFTNPRGSTGYGQEFERGIKNNWGKMDYTDIMTGLDVAIEKNSWIDPARLGVTGGSYGGFMTNWIVGHTNRFQAAVTLRSVVNLISDEGTRDGAYGHEEDFNGLLFDHFEEYWAASPLKYAKNVKTPTLVLHSDNDLRVPLEQGEQWYRALKLYGVTTELVVFPRENHNLTRTGEPKHIVESMKWQLYWFARFIGKDAGVKPPDAVE